MNVLLQTLDEHERQPDGSREDAKKSAEAWQIVGESPDARLLAFDRWVRAQISQRLVMPADEARKSKLIHQCRAELERALVGMFDRGWLLDGKRLARHVTAMLDPIGKAQRDGKVGDFWPYFSASVRRYVGANAEAIQREAKGIGALAGVTVAALMQAGERAAQTTGELVQQRRDETLKERLQRRREKLAKDAADRAQMPLL